MTPIGDIEQLSFLGMRLALRRSVSAADLREFASDCAKRRNKNLRHWIGHDELPPVHLEGLEKVYRAHERKAGVVVTSFQIGPYNWIPLILNSEGRLPVSLLVDAPNFMEEERRWAARERKYKGSLTEPVRFINAEASTAVWKMACSLREGRTLVGWFDGHTGVTKTESASSTVVVEFCETRMRVRMGMAFLSARAGAPLILAVVRNDGDTGVAVHFEDPLIRLESEPIDQYCLRASQHLVSILEREVRKDPACWEEWCHLHGWNVFKGGRGSCGSLDEETFLDTLWRFDREAADRLAMSDGNVLVSLNSGDALAMTPLIMAIQDALTEPSTARAIVSRLSNQFNVDDLRDALRVLCDSCFIVKAMDPGTDRSVGESV